MSGGEPGEVPAGRGTGGSRAEPPGWSAGSPASTLVEHPRGERRARRIDGKGRGLDGGSAVRRDGRDRTGAGERAAARTRRAAGALHDRPQVVAPAAATDGGRLVL